MKRGVVLLGALLLTASIIGGIVLLVGDRPGEQPASWLLREDPSATEAEVEVLVLVGDLCNEYRRVEVEEFGSEVGVTAIVHNSGAADCSSAMQTREVTVELAAPLGERDLTGCRNEHVDSCSEAPSG